jgi:hypothetical protein
MSTLDPFKENFGKLPLLVPVALVQTSLGNWATWNETNKLRELKVGKFVLLLNTIRNITESISTTTQRRATI